jgi:hypothetical protein
LQNTILKGSNGASGNNGTVAAGNGRNVFIILQSATKNGADVNCHF